MKKAFVGSVLRTKAGNAGIMDTDKYAEFAKIVDPARSGEEYIKLKNKWTAYFTNNLLPIYTDMNGTHISDTAARKLIAERCLVSEGKVRAWVNKSMPSKREDYVSIACCFGLSVKDCNKLMMRYGGFSALNTRCPRDVILSRLIEIGDYSRITEYEAEYERFGTPKARLFDNKFTAQINKASRSNAIKEASEYLEELIKKCGHNSTDAFHQYCNYSEGTKKALQRFNSQNIVPKRNILISVGLHLGLPVSEINKLLASVFMEDLCCKNPFEAAVMFALSRLYKKKPDFGSGEFMISSNNMSIQARLSEGSVFDYVYKYLTEDENMAAYLRLGDVDVDECMRVKE